MVAVGDPVPAVVTLDPTGCNALQAIGNAGVRAYANPDGGTGWLASDSDGTKTTSPNSCGTTGYALNFSTAGSSIWACGTSYDAGDPSACAPGGVIETNAYDAGQTTCLPASTNNACNPTHVSSGQLRPTPIAATSRVTRALADHEWNCKDSYPDYAPYGGGEPSVAIAACGSSTEPFIDQLAALVGPSGAPAGFSTITNCNHVGLTVFPPGNYFVDCSTFTVNGDVTFAGGNIVFGGNVSVIGGHLRINTANPNADVSSSCRRDGTLTEACLSESSQHAAFVYVRGNGSFVKGSSGALTMDHVAVYLDPANPPASGRKIDLSFGSANLTWSAPAQAGSPDPESEGWFFDKLALWSESSAEHRMGGATTFDVRGVLFTPNAFLNYTVGSDQLLEHAQFITLRMAVVGPSILRLAPNPASTLSVVPEPPDTTITSGPPAIDTSADATFTFTTNRPAATFECSVDGAAFAACSSPLGLTLAEGEHELTVQAVDPWGQADPTPASAQWTIDLTAPTTTAVVPEPHASGWYGEAVPVTLVATDAASGVAETWYRLDGGADVAYAGEFTVADGGVHELVYWSTDNAGHVEAENVLAIQIDDIAPTIEFLDQTPAPDAGGWNSGPVTVRWTCSDAETGPAEEIVEVVLETDGAGQSALGTCTDLAGNEASDTVEGINIDSTGPVVTIDSAVAAVAVISGSASDALSGPYSLSVVYTDLLGAQQTVPADCVGCDVAGTPTVAWTAPTPDAPGLYSVSVVATDWAGNAGEAAVVAEILLVPGL